MSASGSNAAQPVVSSDGTAKTTQAGTAAASSDQCMACHKAPIQYACVPCGHATLCRVRGTVLKREQTRYEAEALMKGASVLIFLLTLKVTAGVCTYRHAG